MTNPVTIIMVEDDEGHARLIERNIRRSGVNNEILPFTDGTSAVNYLFGKDGTGSAHKGQALLVLLDLNLPAIGGLEVLRRIRADDRFRRLPIVILTSSNEDSDKLAGYGLGANSYVRKPVDFRQFSEAVTQLGLYWMLVNEPPPR